MRIKLSEIENIGNDIHTVLYDDPIRQHVRFGCDCGCGGDYYTAEEWDQLLDSIDEARDRIEQFCEKNNIELDVDIHFNEED